MRGRISRTTLNEGRSISSGDTPGQAETTASQPRALNEGRSISSGDDPDEALAYVKIILRSTKAGA